MANAPCPRNTFRCGKCELCVPLSTPYEKHIGKCLAQQARNRAAARQRGRHAK